MRKSRLLVIDDEMLIRRAMTDYLTECGYETASAPDGEAGLAMARAEKFDAVLVDLRMPRLDGLGVIVALQAEQPDLPVVVVSGTGVLSDAIEAIRRGAWDYITKPIRDMDEILVVVERVLDKAHLIHERDSYQSEIENLNRSLAAKVAQQTKDLRTQNRSLTVLNRVISAAAATLEPVRILQVLCAELAVAFNLPQIIAMSIDFDAAVATVVTEYRELNRPSLIEANIPLEQPAIAHILKQQQPLFIANAKTDPRLSESCIVLCDQNVVTMLLVPVVVHGRVINILSLQSIEPHSYNSDDLDLIRNAAVAAAQALETVNLHQELQKHAEALEVTVAQRTAELSIALKQARAADEAKSRFLSNVSHELRTPLTSIRLYLGLLERGREEQRERYLESLSRETERLQTLIEGLLTLSRLDLGKTQAQLYSVSLNDLLDTLANDRSRLFTERGLDLRVNFFEDLPLISADTKLLEQVATNLLTNAMNYTPSGGSVHLSTAMAEFEGRPWVTFSVADTGPGISDEDQAHLFERFYRGTASYTSEAPGTGLGLSICKEIVTLHHGQITLNSTPGEGSTFTVWLPCDKCNPV